MSFENLISETIAEKIIQAHSTGKDFKIIVMMPLLPGFEGDPRDEKAGVLRGQMQLQF
jgi:phospholipase D1/2